MVLVLFVNVIVVVFWRDFGEDIGGGIIMLGGIFKNNVWRLLFIVW